MPNVQSISPNSPPHTTHEIGGSARQGTLPVGPTGRVHKGGGGVPWAKRCAQSTAPSPSGKLLFMILSSFVNGPDEAAWPSQSTLASMTGLSSRGVRNATKQLEAAGRIRVERMGGDRGIRYWLEAEVSSPSRRKSVPVEAEVSSPEVPKEGTCTRKAAAVTVETHEVQQHPVEPPTLLLNTFEKGNDDLKPKTDEIARHTCDKCDKSWPVRFGNTCFTCQGRVGASHHAGQAAPEPKKYDELFDSHESSPDPPARPDPPPMKPETRVELEANARASGFHRIGGKWMKL